MTRLRLHAVCFILTTCAFSASNARADELFSRIKTDEVFARSTPADVKPGETPAKTERIADVSQLFDRLRDSGLEPQKDGEDAVNITLQHSKWNFPIRLELIDQAQKVLVQLGLESADKKPLPADRLMGLLAANSQIRPACFTFSITRKRLELAVQLTNDTLNVRALREELRNLATLAEKTAPAWEVTSSSGSASTDNSASAPAQGSQAAAPNKSAPNASAANPASFLVGKWSANRANAENFTLQLGADGAFELSHTKSGRTTRSKGRYELSGRQLTLTASDKVKIVAEISNITARSFDFTPGGTAAAKLTFQKAS
jgi:uncharacterized protein (TIGR03066 family)